ncbi:MAG TPA: hypothetical protein VGG65_07210, partial [Thermoanaerobaculia bacterium]
LTDRDENLFAPTAFSRAIDRRDPEGHFRAVDASRYRPPSALEHTASGANFGGAAYARRSWYFHTPSLWRRGTVFNSDLDAGDLSRTESLRRVSSLAAADPSGAALFESVALRFGIRYRDQAPLTGFSRFGGDALQEWDENPAALPDTRLVSRWREASSAVEGLAMLARLGPGEVVLETGRAGQGQGPGGTVRVLERSQDRLSLATSTPGPGWLFVLRAFWTFRDVRVDGVRVVAFPAQLAFSAIPVPAGEHRIQWREEVPGIRFSWMGPSVFALAAVLSLARRPARAEAA